MVRRPDGRLAVGRSNAGRGAWLCQGSAPCLDRAGRKRALERALRGTVAERAVDELRRELGYGPDVRGWMESPSPVSGDQDREGH